MRDMLQALQDATGGQRAAVEALVDGAAAVMERAAGRFSEALDTQAQQAASASAQSGSTAVELASMAEAFAQGVQLFQATGERLVAGLERIEGSLERSTARSDEQMAYYVAQAREVIDLSITSQQGLVESLRELKAQPRRAQAMPEGADA
jgi:ABC-type transporter Mla subunit MlaD